MGGFWVTIEAGIVYGCPITCGLRPMQSIVHKPHSREYKDLRLFARMLSIPMRSAMKPFSFSSALLVVSITIVGLGIAPIAVQAEQDVQISDSPTERPIAERLQSNGMNPEATKKFVQNMRSAAQINDRKALVGMIRYPFTTYDVGKPVITYHRQTEVLRDFNLIFTPKVLKTMREAQYENLFVRDQGAMIGSGEAWFNQRKDGIKFSAINSL